MVIKRYVLAFLLVLATGILSFSVKAQPKKGTHRTNFSGKWKANESISMGGNIFCSYESGDRMVAKRIKIVEQADFLTIENPDSNASSKNLEKWLFNGKTSQINHSQGNRKMFSVKLSHDGQTMTVKSIVYFMTETPYKVNVQQQAFTNVTEIWKLSKDGKSITVLAKAKSNIWDGERSWKTLFVKTP